MFGGKLCVAISYMLRARIEPKFDTIPARLLVMFLAFAQPLVRGWSRYFTWLHFKRTPRGVIRKHEQLPVQGSARENLRRLVYWNEEGKDRHQLLTSVLAVLEEEGWRYSTDTGWNEWDIQIYGNFWWSIVLQTVTEYHGGMKALTRAAIRYRFVATTMIINLVALSIVIYRQLNRSHIDLWSVIPFVCFLIFLALRARRLKLRVAELVDVAAHRIGLQRIFRRGAKAAAARTPINVPANVN
jgi:O-antigen biosynthesis protein